MMRNFGWLVVFAAASFAWTRPAGADLRIAATVPDLAAIAQEIGGDHVRVTSLSLPTQDPHFVDARPNLVLELARADMLLSVGMELEVGWLPTLITGSRNGKVQRGGEGFLDCSTLVVRMEVPTTRVDRSMGDLHPQGNPHYLYDPRAAERVARGIGERMAAVDSARAQVYRAGADGFVRRLRNARRDWERRLGAYGGTKVIAFHRSWPYLADWLHLQVIDHIEPRPGIPPNPGHVAKVLRRSRREAVRLILQEVYYPDTTSRLVQRRTGAQLVKIRGGADFRGGEGYVEHMAHVVAQLERALRG